MALSNRIRAGAVAALAAVLFALTGLGLAHEAWSRGPAPELQAIEQSDLPPEARHTLGLIRKGGPFPYERDGAVFGNFERLLPRRDRGYYREYTVRTPGLTHRGARRIVAGRAGELYYTDDHYRSFKRVRE